MTKSTESKVKIEGKFYPLRNDEWLELGRKLTRGELLVLFHLRTLEPFGDRLTESSTKDVSEAIGINQRSVQRALIKLKDLELIDLQFEKFSFRLRTKHATPMSHDDTHVALTTPMSDSNDTHVRFNDTHVALTTPMSDSTSETLTQSGSDFPHTLKTYKEFFNTLSEPERERFLNFVNKKIEGFTKPIASVNDWLAAPDSSGSPRFEDYYSQFKKSPHEVRNRELQEAEALRVQLAKEKIYWLAHPQFEAWVQEIAIAKSQTPFIEDVRKLFLAIDPQSFDRSDFWEWVILSRHHIPAAAPTPSISISTSTSEPQPGAHTEEARHSFKDKLKAQLDAKKNGGRHRQNSIPSISAAELNQFEMSIKSQ